MAKYTAELNQVVDWGFQIFDESWTTFDPAHKSELCRKIINHYYFNEIGAETPERFIFYINTHLREIMPYYNMLYETSLLDLLPLYNQYVETISDSMDVGEVSGQRVSKLDNKNLQTLARSMKNIVDSTANEDTTTDKIGSRNWTENDVRNLTENETTDFDKTSHTTENEKTVKDTDANKTGTEDETKNDDYTRNTTSTTDQDTTTTATKTTSAWSSDTPQGEIVNNTFQIDSNYLTRYDHGSESTSGKGTLDETVNGEETYSATAKRDLDTTEKQTIKETTTRDLDSTTTEQADTVRNLTANETIDKTYKENYTENIAGNRKNVANDTTKNFENSSTDTANSTLESSADETKDKRSTTTKVVVKGNVGVTRSQLIAEYRKTYVNVDFLIIRELANNFMGVL